MQYRRKPYKLLKENTFVGHREYLSRTLKA